MLQVRLPGAALKLMPASHNQMAENKDGGQGHKEVTLIVNGREKKFLKEEISFAEVVTLAFDTPPSKDVMYTVTYRRGQGSKPDGTLVHGQSVKVKDGMIFNVTATNKS
jgi:hypothetical protein